MFLVLMLILLLLSLLFNRIVWRKRRSIPDTIIDDTEYIYDAMFCDSNHGYADTVECGYQEKGKTYLCKSCQEYGKYKECNANVRIIRRKIVKACKYSTSISYNPSFRF